MGFSTLESGMDFFIRFLGQVSIVVLAFGGLSLYYAYLDWRQSRKDAQEKGESRD